MAAALRGADQPLGAVQEVAACFTFLGNDEFWRGNVRISGADPLGALGDLGEAALRGACLAFLQCSHRAHMHCAADPHDMHACRPNVTGCATPSSSPIAAAAGWYCVQAILWAFGWEAPASVAADAGPVFSESGIPLHIGATLVFSGGRRGRFECGEVPAARCRMQAEGGGAGAALLHAVRCAVVNWRSFVFQLLPTACRL